MIVRGKAKEDDAEALSRGCRHCVSVQFALSAAVKVKGDIAVDTDISAGGYRPPAKLV